MSDLLENSTKSIEIQKPSRISTSPISRAQTTNPARPNKAGPIKRTITSDGYSKITDDNMARPTTPDESLQEEISQSDSIRSNKENIVDQKSEDELSLDNINQTIEDESKHETEKQSLKDNGFEEKYYSDSSDSISIADSEAIPKKKSISLVRAVVNLTNVISGVGLLGMPYTFCTGIFANYIIILIIGLFSLFSFSVLIDCAKKTNVWSYSGLINEAFIGKNVGWVPDVLLVITLVFCAILYYQFALSLMTSFLTQLGNCPDILLDKWFLTFVVQLLIEIPIISMKTANALTYISYFSTLLVFVYLFHSVYYFFKSLHDHGFNPNKRLRFVDLSFSKIIKTLSVQSSSYTCHMSVLSRLEQVRNPTKSRLNLAMIYVVIAATVLYTIGGIFPYFTLFDDIKDSVVFNHYPKQVFTNIMKILYSLVIMLTAPNFIFDCRISLARLIFRKQEKIKFRYLFLIGIFITLLCLLISVTVNQIGVIFNFLGGVIFPAIVYILPSIYYQKICRGDNKFKYTFSYVSIVAGFIFIVICLYDSVVSLL